MTTRDYPYIRAYGRMVHSYAYYIADQQAQARRDNAPADAWFYDLERKEWNTMAHLKAAADTGNVAAEDTYTRLWRAVNETTSS